MTTYFSTAEAAIKFPLYKNFHFSNDAVKNFEKLILQQCTYLNTSTIGSTGDTDVNCTILWPVGRGMCTSW